MRREWMGIGRLIAFLLRKDRLKIATWLAGLFLVTVSTAGAYPSVYKTSEDLMGFALTMENPAMKAMLGPGYDGANLTTSLAFATEMLMFSAIAAAVMNILLVGRATRADEEAGRLELIRSLPVGRLSYLGAALTEALVVNGLLALLIGAGLSGIELEGLTAEGAFLYGAILGSSGFFFAGITALFAQLAETSRGAQGFAFGTLIAVYILRAVGDVEAEAASLLSPLGWVSRAYVFRDNEWWPVWLSLATTAILVAVSLFLNVVRDMGAGILPARKGRRHATALLKTPVGFVLRQQRTAALSWTIGLFLLAASFGAILGELETYYSDMELIVQMLGEEASTSLTESFLSLLIVIMTLFSIVPGLLTVLKLQREEAGNRTELIYSGAVSRGTLLGAYGTAALLLSVVMQGVIALGIWAVGASHLEKGLSLKELMQAVLVYLPAMWVVLGLAILLIGVAPRAAHLVWLYFAYCFIVVYLGDLLEFPDWLKGLSTFHHVPELLVETFRPGPVLMLFLLFLFFILAGYTGYRRRDITG
jgi:ABC-2 type transport system permease protein